MSLRIEIFPGLRDSTGHRVRQFLAWWRSELSGAWEDWSLRRSGAGGGRGQILVEGGELVLVRVVPEGRQVLASAPCPAVEAALPACIGQLLQGRKFGPRELEIVLPATAVLTRQVHLPEAMGRRLRQAVGYQLEKLMPLKAELAYFDCAVAARDEAARRLLVSISETRRGLVDGLADVALECGIQRVTVVAETGGAGRAHFLRKSAGRASSAQPLVYRWLAGATAALAVAAGSVLLIQYHAENRRLEAAVEALKLRAGEAAKLRDGLDERLIRMDFLADRLQGTDQAVVLVELTRLLPEDAWVFQYQAEGAQLNIAGFAKDASAISSQLSKSTLFKDVTLRAAVKTQGMDGERFDIGIHLKERAP